MARRRAERHAPEALALISPGMRVLDCGCGPGTITLGLAAAAAPGEVMGVDAAESQVEQAAARAREAGAANARFLRADVERLPVGDAGVDLVHANALVEHLARPVAAIREMARALRPGGAMVLTSPDWDGFLLAPEDESAEAALAAYRRIQERNGGDTRAGRRLGALMAEAGLVEVSLSARYECYEDPALIAGYLARTLEEEGDAGAGAALRAWAERPAAMFAQAWVTAVGRRPGSPRRTTLGA